MASTSTVAGQCWRRMSARCHLLLKVFSLVFVLNFLLTSLTHLEVDELALPMSHLEWRTDSAHPSSAPLQLVKTAPGKSTYLYRTTNPLTSRIARLRHNRVFTQVARSRFEDKLISPNCTWPSCRASTPVHSDSVVHILTQCGRHSLSRKLLLKELHNIDPRRYPSVSHTCLLTVLGEIYPRSSFSLSILPKCQRIFRALADFFYHITLDRGGDGGASLRLF